MYLKVLFARVYVKNPPRVTTYTKLKPPQLLRVKNLTVVGTPLRYITIHEHKTNATSGSAKVFFSHKDFEIWTKTINDQDASRPAYPVDKTLRGHIKQGILKICNYQLKDIRWLRQAVEMKCGNGLEKEVCQMLFHYPDTARRHYRDTNALKTAALAFVTYQKQLGNFELKMWNENEKEFVHCFVWKKVKLQTLQKMLKRMILITSMAITMKLKRILTPNFWNTKVATAIMMCPEIVSTLKRKTTSLSNFQQENLSSDADDYTIFEG